MINFEKLNISGHTNDNFGWQALGVRSGPLLINGKLTLKNLTELCIMMNHLF